MEGFRTAGEGTGICERGAKEGPVGGFGGEGTIVFRVSGVISVMVLVGSGLGGIMGGALFSLPYRTTLILGVAVDCCGAILGAGAAPNSTTAGAVGSGLDTRPLMTFSALVGILKFGAFGMGRGTDSDWSMTGFGAALDGVVLFPSRVNSSEGAAAPLGMDFMDSCFCGADIFTEVGPGEEKEASDTGAEVSVFTTGRISSTFFDSLVIGL